MENDQNNKLDDLEKRLDDALVRVYELEGALKQQESVRFELEEMLRSIYYESKALKEVQDKPELDDLLDNLAANIDRLFTDYKIKL